MLIYIDAYGSPVGRSTKECAMADANVDDKSFVETKSDEPEIKHRENNSPWREQPSVLKSPRFKIGKGEVDYVD